MAFPDDDHVPVRVLGEDGKVIAVIHCAPDISEEAQRAGAALVAEALRLHEANPNRAEMDARQAVSRAKIRERNARLRGGG